MTVKLLTEHNLEFLSLKGGYTGSSKSIHIKKHIFRNHMSRLKWLKVFLKILVRIPLELFLEGGPYSAL